MEEILRNIEPARLIDLLGYAKALDVACHEGNYEQFMHLIYDDRTKKILNRAATDVNLIRNVAIKVGERCNVKDLKKIIRDKSFPIRFVSYIVTYSNNHPLAGSEQFKRKYLITTLKDPRFKNDYGINEILVQSGVYTHVNQLKQYDLYMVDNADQRSMKIKSFLKSRIKSGYWGNNFPWGKYKIKLSLYMPFGDRVNDCYSEDMLPIRYRFKLRPKIEDEEDKNEVKFPTVINHTVKSGLILYQRKSLDAMYLLHNQRDQTRENMNRTKLVYSLLVKLLAKFTTKNMTKLILYH